MSSKPKPKPKPKASPPKPKRRVGRPEIPYDPRYALQVRHVAALTLRVSGTNAGKQSAR